jgi:sodium/hydrogen exchanger 8
MSRCLVLLLACVAAPTVVAKHQRTAQERLAQIWGWETGSVKVQHRVLKKEAQHRILNRASIEDYSAAEIGRLEAAAEAEEHEREEEMEVMIKWTIVLSLAALAVTYICGYLLELRHIHRLPEAGVGLIIGFLLSWGAQHFKNHDMLATEQFDYEFFMIWLLPPIIFEAGFNMNASSFFENIGPTMFFAFIGTFASTFIVGGVIYAAGQAGFCYPLGLLACLVFGSLISATDPVTVLAVFQALGVKDDLFSMVFGESVLNDAVAIVLSTTLLTFNTPDAQVDAESIMTAVTLFATIFGGSMVVGLVYGVASSLVYKKLDLRHHPEMVFMEVALSTTFPFAAYYTAEAMHLSGIVTILFCGMIMAQYTRNCFSENAKILASQVYKVMAVVAETFVFVYLGMAAFAFPIFNHPSMMLVLIALAACFVGRLHIYIGSWGTNAMRKTDGSTMPPISPRYQFLMWFSGLRGGVAFAIASVGFAQRDFTSACGGLTEAQLEEALAGRGAWVGYCDTPGMSDSLAVLQTTLIIAVFTIFVFGGLITEVAVALDVLTPKHLKGKRAAVDPAKKPTGFEAFSNKHIRPLLTFDGPDYQPVRETGVRFEAAVESFAKVPTPANKLNFKEAVQMVVMRSKDIKSSLSEPALEAALKGSGLAVRESLFEDTIDEMRVQMPMYSTDQLRKILEENGGNMENAVRAASPGKSGGAKEML